MEGLLVSDSSVPPGMLAPCLSWKLSHRRNCRNAFQWTPWQHSATLQHVWQSETAARQREPCGT